MLEIRNAEQGDLDPLLELYRNLHPSDSQATREELEGVWRELLTSSGVDLLIGWIDGRAVTSCTLATVPNLTRGARPYALIENVVTAADHRGRGYASAVLRFALAKAWERNCYKVMLLTGSSREETWRFYENAGFRRGLKTGFVAYRTVHAADDGTVHTRFEPPAGPRVDEP